MRNIGSILRHIRTNHCRKSEENRQLTRAAETHILSPKEDLKTRPVHPLFQTETSIPKALSMSCINTSWKSNQTEITKTHIILARINVEDTEDFFRQKDQYIITTLTNQYIALAKRNH